MNPQAIVKVVHTHPDGERRPQSLPHEARVYDGTILPIWRWSWFFLDRTIRQVTVLHHAAGIDVLGREVGPVLCRGCSLRVFGG